MISFANEMDAQHTQEEQALAPIGTSVGDPVPPPTSLNPVQQQMAATLQATPEPACDGVYINGEISGHQMNIANNFQPEISGGTNAAIVNDAETYLAQVQTHLQLAQQIEANDGF